MIERILSNKIKYLFQRFPVITLTGPRQSGKSTLTKMLFPELPYVNLEDINSFSFATEDPQGFIQKYKNGAVIDEIQKAPQLFSAIQVEVDRQNKNSLFILTGSQNFLLLEKVSQSLAGRTAILHLLPFSLEEIQNKNLNKNLSLEDHIFSGGYPRIIADQAPVNDWMRAYIQTYVERDVRSLKNITDLYGFQRFMKACAARIGAPLDYSSLGNDLGLSHNTIRSWVDVLETSFVVYRLQPHFKNYQKRLTKTPKLYFYDTGLACSLLNIQTSAELEHHALRGPLFECFAMSEIKKYFYHRGLEAPLYFWRDRKAEVDCLIEAGLDRIVAIEMKSSQTLHGDQFASLHYWLDLAQQASGHMIYGGNEKQSRPRATVWPWRQIHQCMEETVNTKNNK
jgi:predicted AAA+ superfamily ATPase